MLHKVGLIIYFDDRAAGLEDAIILRPQVHLSFPCFIANAVQWLVDTFSTVVNAKHKALQSGLISEDTLLQVFLCACAAAVVGLTS